MTLSKTFSLAALAGLTLAGCTASRYQISDALMRYGLNENQASCAAEFLRGHLSTGQVGRLSKAKAIIVGLIYLAATTALSLVPTLVGSMFS